MKHRLLSVLFACTCLLSSLLAGPRDKQWKEVFDAINEGQPKTAIERLEPILAAANAEQAHAEAIHALAWKIALQGNIEGNKPEEKIVRLQAELPKAAPAARPVLETILAEWYWQYFQRNRWRFLQRTQTAEPPGEDIQTWDLARILAEIDRHFTAALADPKALQSAPIGDFKELLTKGTAPDAYRPTLFDFLVNEALQFYQAGEQAAVEAEETFEIEDTSPIFATAEAFLRWEPQTPAADIDSPKLKAIRLYQALLRFHEHDTDRSAFFDADLARLTYGFNVAVGDDKAVPYKAALERFIAQTQKHETQARALATLATQLNAEDEPALARELAQRGLAAFPKSVGGAMCFNLIAQIEAPSAQVTTEFTWNAPWPTLDVTYRNVQHVYFRAVPLDFNRYVAEQRWGFGSLSSEQREKLLDQSPAIAWDAPLPATKNFRQRTERLPVPTTLQPGFYAILASHRRSFDESDNQLSVATGWVTNLALVLRTGHQNLGQGGFVLQANSGDPVAGANVRFWHRNREGRFLPIAPTRSDENGWFEFPTVPPQQSLIVLAEHAGHALSSLNEVHQERFGRTDGRDAHTIFFTDRALYRPGQTIHYKGICVRTDRDEANYETLSRRSITVLFRDPNGEEIARASHVTNEYGSFSGVFTAPANRLTGRMTLVVEGGPNGATSFAVEEYKRPKFQVELAAPAEAARLNAPVKLTGKATAYTRAAIGGARVKWRVERGVQLPRWCWWWTPPANKAIAHGTATTEPDGTFAVEFPATADPAVPAKNEPVFVFTVYADVTDTTGETRSDERALRAGYTALQAEVIGDEWQTVAQPVQFTLTTQSLDFDPQPASGALVVHAVKQPERVQRAMLDSERRAWWPQPVERPADPANPDAWDLGAEVQRRDFTTDASGTTKVAMKLPAGIYRAMLDTKDRFGKTVTARLTFQVIDPQSRDYPIRLANHFAAPKWSVEPGEKFVALWGTGYECGRVFVELECAGKRLKSYWTRGDRTQELIELPVTEQMRGGFTVRATYVRENRGYINQRVVEVPWSDRQLAVKWERFRSKLLPGEKETWTAVVTGPDAQRAAAEMVATLYDASLDQFQPHHWPSAFPGFRQELNAVWTAFQNGARSLDAMKGGWRTEYRDVDWSYRAFPQGIIGNLWGYGYARARGLGGVPEAANAGEMVTLSAFSIADDQRREKSMMAAPAVTLEMAMPSMGAPQQMDAVDNAAPQPKPDLSKITARRNLNETAFFFPHLTAGDDGTVRMTFTMPEALTEWKFLGFAHDRQLRAGSLTGTVVTAKDLMVEPNPPRFVREGDAIEFTVKVSNQSDQPQQGTVRLTFADAASLQPADEALANRSTEQPFDVPAKQSRTYSWRIAIPDGMGFLTYKAVAASASFSDGEEGFLPVLSRRILVTESLPLPIRGATTKHFQFTKLLESGSSNTLRHQSLTVQMTSQPAWYAVMALPYLMEFPYECSEQVFNRLYANVLARHIANSDPKIRRVFDLWKNTPALDSPLEKNQELKSVLLEETPWVREAHNESAARRNVGLLFDANRLDEETPRTLDKLVQQQLGDGRWPWFPGGRPSDYITLYITTGFGRLRHLGVELDVAPAIRSLTALDAWMDERYREILRGDHPEEHTPTPTEALYLYGRSFFLDDQPVATEHRKAVDFFLNQARKRWLDTNSRQSQAHLALALQRFGDEQTPAKILRSLKERSVSNEELGMFWRELELSWWWYRAPIETQALMIEVFEEIGHDEAAVDACRVWLLKQKQTQAWPTTKSTADAIYGLLLRGGTKLLASDALVEVSLGGQLIKPEKVEAGTGFYEQKFAANEITPALGEITVKKVDDGVSWGGVHWQYLEDMAKVTPHEGTPLRLKKTLFVKETTGRGQVLQPVRGPLAVGDELVVRIELRTDRDMEFVHLKDQRGSGTEPVNVLSRYRYQDGLAYYESTRDTASHFFIDYLPKGTYVFEYSTRVQLRGSYQSGIAEIQCMYAPEFNSHSESFALEVQ
ncbi:alpha-2-macroglobulin family protein [Opitutus terrae]|uniref:Alpha-2-macroglobulin domain-containing protein n=1 Tax=Opitutus terrae (strain DSM 11246 / JCM 15787 / PB90-1) TaxID=452637 RepID=B1ZNR8_OPITP|nr:alpha-2-macroglobulin family protein [Opitutus terrae]ACB75438.1 conserved hypothetical protein-putative secreted protein [Opitutus terrae PB90-1]